MLFKTPELFFYVFAVVYLPVAVRADSFYPPGMIRATLLTDNLLGQVPWCWFGD
jgi:hypothetical protein